MTSLSLEGKANILHHNHITPICEYRVLPVEVQAIVVCVRACVRAWVGGWVGGWVGACVRACVRASVHGWMVAFVCACGRTYVPYLNIPYVFSEIKQLNNSPKCTQWGSDAHPIDYAVDPDSSTFWLSRSGLPSVDLLFDLRGIWKVSIASLGCNRCKLLHQSNICWNVL